jgi:hypothetical protein
VVSFKEVAAKVGRTAVRLMVLAFFAGSLAISVNAWQSKPLPLLADWSPNKRPALPNGDALTIPLGHSPIDTRLLA